MKEFVRVCGASSGRFEVASSEFVVEFVVCSERLIILKGGPLPRFES